MNQATASSFNDLKALFIGSAKQKEINQALAKKDAPATKLLLAEYKNSLAEHFPAGGAWEKEGALKRLKSQIDEFVSGTEKQVAEREKLDAIQAVDTKFTHKQEAIFAAKKKGDIPTVTKLLADYRAELPQQFPPGGDWSKDSYWQRLHKKLEEYPTKAYLDAWIKSETESNARQVVQKAADEKRDKINNFKNHLVRIEVKVRDMNTRELRDRHRAEIEELLRSVEQYLKENAALISTYAEELKPREEESHKWLQKQREYLARPKSPPRQHVCNWPDVTGLAGGSAGLFIVSQNALYSINAAGEYSLLGHSGSWTATKGVAYVEGRGLYVADQNKIYHVDLPSGAYKTVGGSNWPSVTGLVGSGDGKLYAISQNSLYMIDVGSGNETQIGASGYWSGNVRGFTSIQEKLFLICGGNLYSIAPNGNSEKLAGSWPEVDGMASLNGMLFIVSQKRLYQMNPANGHSDLMKDNWPNVVGVAATKNKLHILSQNTLYEVDPQTGASSMFSWYWK